MASVNEPGSCTGNLVTTEVSRDGRGGQWIEVEVAYARPDRQCILQLGVPTGTTLLEAVTVSGILDLFPEIDIAVADLGIWGRVVSDGNSVLSACDRVEIYRPLQVDPRAARKARAASMRQTVPPRYGSRPVAGTSLKNAGRPRSNARLAP